MKALEIFLVEDNPGDVVLTREALAGYPIPVELVVAHDGEEALAMLSAPGFKPNVIILDLNMARIDGHTVLERYRQKDVPTVIFSSTQNGAEVQRALALGAREFVKKPLSFSILCRCRTGDLRSLGAKVPSPVRRSRRRFITPHNSLPPPESNPQIWHRRLTLKQPALLPIGFRQARPV